MNNKRSNRGYAMDGFVRRPRPGAQRRPSIDNLKNSPRRSKADGFVPTPATAEAAGINDEWSLTDENTLTMVQNLSVIKKQKNAENRISGNLKNAGNITKQTSPDAAG
jgi:hypothetical protein